MNMITNILKIVLPFLVVEDWEYVPMKKFENFIKIIIAVLKGNFNKTHQSTK